MTAWSVQSIILMIVLFFLVKVDSACRTYLKHHVHVKLEKEPEIPTSEMIKWMKTNQQKFDLTHIKAIILFQFTNRNMRKFREQATLDRKKGSGGSNKTPGKTVGRIKKLIINKKGWGSRCVAAKVGVSHMTVCRILKTAGAHPYHRMKVQMMTDQHKEKRVEFSRWALQKYGTVVNGRTAWGHLVNTDFPAMVKQHGNLNSKNDVMWTNSKEGGTSWNSPRRNLKKPCDLSWGEPQGLGAFKCPSLCVI